jgi:purine-binding chemotaxis protein CheW
MTESSIIILDLGELFLGMVVDSIDSVLALTNDELGPPPTMEKTGQEKYIVGVARKDNRLTLILDIEALLNVQDFEALKNSSQKAA